jgi:N-acetylneuraminic acid mutarotase
VNDKLYVLGGVTAGSPGEWNPSALDVYDPATDTWTRKADITTRRSGAAAAAVGGRIYFIGGVTGDLHNAPISTVEEYDPATDTWTRKANMPTARAFLSASAVGGKIYVVGGGTWSGAILTTVEVYDPTTDAWFSGPPMPTSRVGLATSVVNGKLYAIGGTQQWYPGLGMSTVEEYDSTPSVSLRRIGNFLSLSWNGILQSTDTLDASTWLDVTPAPSRIPLAVDPSQTGPMKFYRAR